jgi:hypothetical protein
MSEKSDSRRLQRRNLNMMTKKDLLELAEQAPQPGDWVLITPKKHGIPLFWRPDSAGYTNSLLAAGRYSQKDAQDICHGSHGEVRAYRIGEKGISKQFWMALGHFDGHVVAELAVIYAKAEKAKS